jgi:hypothetical protein
MLDDPFDGEGMQRAADAHKESFNKFCEAVRIVSPDALLLNTGPCKRCAKCTYRMRRAFFRKRWFLRWKLTA